MIHVNFMAEVRAESIGMLVQGRVLALGMTLCLLALGVGCDSGSGKKSQQHLADPPSYASGVSNVLNVPGPFLWVVSDLSPVQLLVSSESRLSLFVGAGTGGEGTVPKYLAMKHSDTQRVLTNAVAGTVTNLNEGWMMVWGGEWAGQSVDIPWVLFFQHAPKAFDLNATGLHLEFHGPMGWVGLMPLYGGVWPAATKEGFAARGMDSKVHPKVWEWAHVVPREPLSRARLWAGTLSQWPIAAWLAVEDQGLHARFEGISLPREWHPTSLALAPLDIRMAEVATWNGKGVKFSDTPFDMQMGTNGMAWWGVMQTDRYSVGPTAAQSPLFEGLKKGLVESVAGGVTHERWKSWGFVARDAGVGGRYFESAWQEGVKWPVLAVRSPGVGVGDLKAGEIRIPGRDGFRSREVRRVTPNVVVTEYR